MSWIILIGCAIAIVFYTIAMVLMQPVYGYADRDEEAAAPECQQLTYDLYLNGEMLETGDLTEEQCSAMAELLDGQTPPFSRIECKKRFVCRQEL